jgi:hypothetical protein
MQLRCFVGFFGITRGIEYTSESISKKVLLPLSRAGIQTTCFAHFNEPTFLHAPRSGEHNVPFKTGNLAQLCIDRLVIEPQSEANIQVYLQDVLSLPVKFGEQDAEGSIRKNALHQLHSLRRLGQLFEDSGTENVDFILLARPDMRYLDSLPIQQVLSQLGLSGLPGVRTIRRRFEPVADLVAPSWHQWGGLNDRFAIATPTAARSYLNRINLIPAFVRSHAEFQGEALLKFAMERDGVRTTTTWMRAERVRSDGTVPPLDIPGRKERLRRAFTYPVHRALQI